MVRDTEPVGVGFVAPPLTVTPTLNACTVVTLDAEGVTVTVGVFRFVKYVRKYTTLSEPRPVASSYPAPT